MNPEVKKKWLNALRSGAYEQVTGALCKIKNEEVIGYCCLGVLAEIAVQDDVIESSVIPEYATAYATPENYRNEIFNAGYRVERHDHYHTSECKCEGFYFETATLPDKVVKWAGLTSDNPTVLVDDFDDEGRYEISEVNDSLRYDFLQIAEIIEEQL